MKLANPGVESYSVDEGTPAYDSAYNTSESDLEKLLSEKRANKGVMKSAESETNGSLSV